MLPLGVDAPEFSLPATDGRMVSLESFPGAKGYLVMFICNHCPFVKHVRPALARLTRQFQSQGVGVVAISSNDAAKYPADGPERMKEEVAAAGYTFPYLYDESQEVAKAYKAACTPDFFLFGADRKLAYRGGMDASRPGNNIPVTGEELTAAVEALLAGKKPSADQKPSVGCNIKWKPGREPEYFR
jgi:peroxiredoxin